jgi:hypothetical protein
LEELGNSYQSKIEIEDEYRGKLEEKKSKRNNM